MHSINIFDCCSTVIIYVANTLNNIYLGGTLLYGFTYTYYDDQNYSFERLFQKYTTSAVNNIYHPYIVEEWRANVYKAAYKYILHKDVYISSEEI